MRDYKLLSLELNVDIAIIGYKNDQYVRDSANLK